MHAPRHVTGTGTVVATRLTPAASFIRNSDIMDTGSTDGTQEIIRRVMAEMGKSGVLEEEPFVDFA